MEAIFVYGEPVKDYSMGFYDHISSKSTTFLAPYYVLGTRIAFGTRRTQVTQLHKDVYEKILFNILNSFSIAFKVLNESQPRSNSFLRPDDCNASLYWRPLEVELVKINFDGAFSASSHACGLGVVVWDWRSSFLQAKSDRSFVDSALPVECLVTYLALSIAHVLGLRCLILEGNSLEAINLLSDPNGELPWAVSGIIQDCFSFIQTFDWFSCIHVKRCAILVANRLAKFGLGSKTLDWWSTVPPLWLE